MPPCNNACGTNEKISYLDLVKRGSIRRVPLIKEDMPFSVVTGRVCYHPCEQACNRGQYESDFDSRRRRFSAIWDRRAARPVVKPAAQREKAPSSDRARRDTRGVSSSRVLGYAVTILEKSPKAGGLNRGGIPDWVLPQDVLDREIERSWSSASRSGRTPSGQGRHVGHLRKPVRRLRAGRASPEPNRVRAGRRKKGVHYGSRPPRHRHGHLEVKLGPRVASSAAATRRSTARARRSVRARRK